MKITGECGYSRDAIQEVLDSPIPYSKEGGEEEVNLTEKLFATLTEEQVEEAAQASYAYWLAATQGDRPPTTEERIKFAKRECRRHLMKKTYDQAAQGILETLKYRKERRIDLLRACFHDSKDVTTPNYNELDEERMEKLRTFIRDDLRRQKAYVYGHDKQGHAILIVRSREIIAANEEAFILALLYMMERAIATTESYTKGQQEKIIVILDFGNFWSYMSPSLTSVKTVARTLQNRYTERLYKMVIIDPPFWMRTMYALVQPFLDPITMAKFIMATGDKAKHQALSGLIDKEQAMSFMLPEGELGNDVDMEKYLTETPFHLGYGQVAEGEDSSR